jgi:1,4-alpha-glucan branching enzyme
MAEAKLGKFTFVLHSHLPYVLSHGTWPHGSVWIHEAAAETYIPLWRVFRSFKEQGKKAAITIGVSPVLAEQLSDQSFVSEMNDYVQQRIKAATDDLAVFNEQGDVHKAGIAQMWVDYYSEVEADFNGPLNRDIIGGLRDMQDAGVIEIITCGATHGYLPLLGTDEAVNAQIELAVKSYRKHFGRDPKGIWLPECAYRPAYHWKSPVDDDDPGFQRKGVEEIVQKHGLRYFIVDSHLLQGGKPVGTYLDRFEGLRKLWDQAENEQARQFAADDNREPYRTYFLDATVGEDKDDPVGILTRDAKTSLQVWSGEYGYPGDGAYLDFHKKHFPGGHKYWRVTRATADLGEKEEYAPDTTEGRLSENADHFYGLLQDTIAETNLAIDERFIVSPFDTELFGHWWFEGPRFLEKILTHVASGNALESSHGSELIDNARNAPVIQLPEGSWGEGGHHYIWLNDDTAWSWKLIHAAEKHMTRLVREYLDATGHLKEMLEQLGRELLILESSDWQFLISTIAAADYAEMRLKQHAEDFEFIRELINKFVEEQDVDHESWERYHTICRRDPLFPHLDLSMWA